MASVIAELSLANEVGISKFSILRKQYNAERSAGGLFKYVWPSCYHQALKG